MPTPNCKFGVLWPDAWYEKPKPVPKDRFAFSLCLVFWRNGFTNTQSLRKYFRTTHCIESHLYPNNNINTFIAHPYDYFFKLEGAMKLIGGSKHQQQGSIVTISNFIVMWPSSLDSIIYKEMSPFKHKEATPFSIQMNRWTFKYIMPSVKRGRRFWGLLEDNAWTRYAQGIGRPHVYMKWSEGWKQTCQPQIGELEWDLKKRDF